MKKRFDSKLFDECEVETFRSSGRGGQHVQKTDSAVRLRHLPTGIVVTHQVERSQYLNKLACLEKLHKKIEKLHQKKKKRIPTVISKSAKEKILKKKAKHSKKKQMRQSPLHFEN